MIKGQVTVFDILNSVEPLDKVVVKNKSKIKSTEPVEMQKIVETYTKAESTNRIIKSVDGSLKVEIKNNSEYKTLYFNRNAAMEFQYLKKATVLPKDKIIFYRDKYIPINDIQKQRIQEVKQKYNVKRVIHRHGDENVVIELNNQVLDIIPNGWICPWTNIKHIECADDEVFEDSKKVNNIGKLVKIGDYVKACVGIKNKIFEGTITREYGPCNEILNIVFKKGNTKYSTAIPRFTVVEILENAI